MITTEQVEKHFGDWVKDRRGWPYDSATMIEFGEFCLSKEIQKYDELIKEADGVWWKQVEVILLVNFLRMPEERQKHFFKSIVERNPSLLKEHKS
jgi:hypothetical protein